MSGSLVIDGIKYYFKSQNDKIKIYDRSVKLQNIDQSKVQIDEFTLFPKKGSDTVNIQKPPTTDPLNKKNSSSSKMVLFVEKQNEPDSEDYKFRKLFLTASMTQKKTFTYQLNSKVAKIDDLQNFIISRPKSNVRFDEKKRRLNFSDLSGTPLSKDELQDIYTSLFEQYDDQQALVFMSARKIVNTNATTKKGAFMRNGALYSSDWSNSDVIKVTDSKVMYFPKKN
jgi:hypothetical protein